MSARIASEGASTQRDYGWNWTRFHDAWWQKALREGLKGHPCLPLKSTALDRRSAPLAGEVFTPAASLAPVKSGRSVRGPSPSLPPLANHPVACRAFGPTPCSAQLVAEYQARVFGLPLRPSSNSFPSASQQPGTPIGSTRAFAQLASLRVGLPGLSANCR